MGKRIKRDATNNPEAPWITVIGVVGRVKQYTLDADSRMAMYLPHAQAATRAMNVVLRSAADPAALTAAVRREIRAMDPDLPIYGARSMTARVDESLATRRFSMLLLTLFAALALGIASIGIYGVMAYLVNQGTRELGIRLALGATPALILRMVVSQGMTVALIGVALGLAGAFALTHVMQTLLFGIDAVDPLTFVAIPLLLVGDRPARQLDSGAARRPHRSDDLSAQRLALSQRPSSSRLEEQRLDAMGMHHRLDRRPREDRESPVARRHQRHRIPLIVHELRAVLMPRAAQLLRSARGPPRRPRSAR